MIAETIIEILENVVRLNYLTEDEKIAIYEATNVMHKYVPKKPKVVGLGVSSTVCPCCNKFVNKHEKKHGNITIPRCKWCGQALDWSETE